MNIRRHIERLVLNVLPATAVPTLVSLNQHLGTDRQYCNHNSTSTKTKEHHG